MPDTSGAADLGKSRQPAEQQESPGTAGELAEKAQAEYPGLGLKYLGHYQELVQLRTANAKAEADLARHQGASLMPWTGLQMQFLALLDMIWPMEDPDGIAHRLELDLRVQRRFASQWEAIGRQAAQARLAQGAQLPPELMRQMMNGQVPPGLRGQG